MPLRRLLQGPPLPLSAMGFWTVSYPHTCKETARSAKRLPPRTTCGTGVTTAGTRSPCLACLLARFCKPWTADLWSLSSEVVVVTSHLVVPGVTKWADLPLVRVGCPTCHGDDFTTVKGFVSGSPRDGACLCESWQHRLLAV